MTAWTCPCGATGNSEPAAARHATTCDRLGEPRRLCRVRIPGGGHGRGAWERECGEPVVAGRWCARHLADRERLGGGA